MALVFSTLCCALNTTSDSADVTGNITSQVIDFPVGTVQATVIYTVTNTSSTSCITDMNNKMFAVKTGTSDYQYWNLDDNLSTPAYTNRAPVTDHFTIGTRAISGYDY